MKTTTTATLALLVGACTASSDSGSPDTLVDTATEPVSLEACIEASGLQLEPFEAAPTEITCPTAIHNKVHFLDQRAIEKVAERLGGDPEIAEWRHSVFGALPVSALLESGCIEEADLNAAQTAEEAPVTLHGAAAEAAGHVFLDEMSRAVDELGLETDAHVVFSLWNMGEWTGGVVAGYHLGLDMAEQSEDVQQSGCYEDSCSTGSESGEALDISPYLKACGL